MSLLLTEAQKLSQNQLVAGIVEELVKEIPLFNMLPFQTINGNALAINREDTSNMGSVGFKAANGTWVSDEAKFSQVTFSLYTLGGQADVPRLYQQSMSNINDQMAVQVAIKSKLMGHDFEKRAIYGDASTSQGFDGLHTMLDDIDDDVQTLHMSDNGDGTGDPLTLIKLDEAIDNVKAGKPDMIMMNTAMRRQLTKTLRGLGSATTDRDDYGNFWEYYNGIPFVINDMILNTELVTSDADNKFSASTGGATTSIFVAYLSEGDGLIGVQNGGIETEVFETLEEKDAMRTRIKWYVGLALYSTLSVVRIDGIDPTAAVTA